MSGPPRWPGGPDPPPPRRWRGVGGWAGLVGLVAAVTAGLAAAGSPVGYAFLVAWIAVGYFVLRWAAGRAGDEGEVGGRDD